MAMTMEFWILFKSDVMGDLYQGLRIYIWLCFLLISRRDCVVEQVIVWQIRLAIQVAANIPCYRYWLSLFLTFKDDNMIVLNCCNNDLE